jgi:transposase
MVSWVLSSIQENIMGKRGAKVEFSDSVLSNARRIIDGLTYRDDILMAFSILLTAGGMGYKTTGGILGVSEATVKRMNNAFKAKRAVETGRTPPEWGGDRRSLLSFDEEIEVLDALYSQAEQGHLVTVAAIKAALESKVGVTMSVQTVYNILYRHRWHKVVPDKVHPKNNPENLDEFQKKLFRMRYVWRPSTPAWREKTCV